MDQLKLFEGIEDSKFPQYHAENPHIYEAFKRYAFELIQNGREQGSSEAIINRMRWDSYIRGNDQWKINNNYKPFYSRLFSNEFPQHSEFFHKRRSKFDS
jgi:hypothetical protein